MFGTNYMSKRLSLELQTHFSVIQVISSQNIIKDRSLNRITFDSIVTWFNDYNRHVLRYKKLKISIQEFLSNAEVFETRILKRSDGTYAFYTDLKIHIWYNWYRIQTVKLKIRGKLFLNLNPELLLHSSYSFWPKLSTNVSGWDLASPQPWKNVKNVFSIFHIFSWLRSQPLPLVYSLGQKLLLVSRNFKFHRRDPTVVTVKKVRKVSNSMSV